MRSNNFNQSSTGVNIETNIYYDSDMSQINFNESFVKISDRKYFFTDFGNYDLPDNELPDDDNELPDEYDFVYIRGYSQGEFARIYYRASEMTIDRGLLIDICTRIFYDQILRIEIIINGNIILLDGIYIPSKLMLKSLYIQM